MKQKPTLYEKQLQAAVLVSFALAAFIAWVAIHIFT